MSEEFEALVKGRRSVRKWSSKKVPMELLSKALELATWAPSGGGRQPYHIYVVSNPDKINEIGKAVQDKVDMIVSWDEARDHKETALKWKDKASFFAQAPVLIAVCMLNYTSIADIILSQRVSDPNATAMKEARDNANSAVQSAAAVITQMLLSFHAQELGSVWMTGPVIAKEEIGNILGISDEHSLVALLPVGYPNESPEPPKNRKPLKDLVTTIS